MNTLLIIGATSGMASECAKIWINDKKNKYEKVILVARNKEKLSVIGRDLRARSANLVEIVEKTAEFSDLASIKQVCDEIRSEDGEISTVLIAHGVLCDNRVCLNDCNEIAKGFMFNGTSVVVFLESVVAIMKDHNIEGHIGVIGSVAGDRGRASNYVYGAGKSLVETYVQGVQHALALAKSKIRVTLVKPGPTRTPMTANLDNSKFAPVGLVANDIVKAVNKGKKEVYTPCKWRLIMFIIRNTPSFIFNLINI